MIRYGRLLVVLFILFTGKVFSQACELVNITTTPLRTLPECNKTNGSIVFDNTQGGTAPYAYTLNDTTTRLGAFFNLGLGSYSVIIEDARLCTSTVVVNLLYKEIDDIVQPDNAFTPNGDGLNDTWRIPGIESFGGSQVRVFNRWGQMVHVNSEYSNENGWNGKQGASDLPPATYYYVISIINNCLEEYVNGTVTIIR